MSKLDAFRLWQVDFKYNAVVIVTEIATADCTNTVYITVHREKHLPGRHLRLV